MRNKVSKEKTKLENRIKAVIIFYVTTSIFSMVFAIVRKDFTCILIALLLIYISLMEYFDAKIIKSKDVAIEIQNKIMNDLFNEINQKTKIVNLKDIKIPVIFKKPRQVKMKNRLEYYKQYSKFKVPIIVDKNNVLIDGYTSYLIAKQDEFTKIEVREV